MITYFGIKYFMHDLIGDTNYCVWSSELRHVM